LAISKIENKNDQAIVKHLWTNALSSRWKDKPVWVHGDFATGNS
jgi:aminoglycoside phosphotransferase (APT) family kinase protein